MLILSSRKELGYALAKIMAGAMFIRVSRSIRPMGAEASAVGASRTELGAGPGYSGG